MPQNFELRIPNNGMNRDDESRLIENSESRYILNLRSGSSENANVGGIENIKGTTEVQFDLPAGRNVCIGSYGDYTSHSNFFFIYNSVGNHGIYRYFPETRTVRTLVQEEILAFREFELVNDINVIDNLLYWNDGVNPQRKINIDKADVDDPLNYQTFNYYLGDEYLKAQPQPVIRLEVRDKRYSAVTFQANILLPVNPALTEKTEIAEDIARLINLLDFYTASGATFNASTCGEVVKITSETEQYLTFKSIDSSQNDNYQIVPDNHYQQYSEIVIDVIKYPPHCNPSASVQTDKDIERNFIADKVFQFAAGYIYDDNEKSSISPHSPHIFNKFTCSQFSGEDINNYININLSNFKEILQPDSLQVVKRIELFFREGELGTWKSITEILPKDFIDISNQHYDFYNDSIYDPVDAEAFVRPFYNVPILSKTQEVVKNRMFYGNNLEQYNPVCVNAKVETKYDDVEANIKPPTYNVSGALFIRSALNGNKNGNTNQRAVALHQPIRKDYSKSRYGGKAVDKTVWGGVSTNYKDGSEDMFTEVGQVLPLDGFTIYLAGTDYKTLSRQVIPVSLTTGSNESVSQTSTRVLYNSNPNSNNANEYCKDMLGLMRGTGQLPNSTFKSVWHETNDTQVYSEFTIPNVPNGWYILRVASHKTTKEEYDSKDRAYQKTSTNVYKITNLNTVNNTSLPISQREAVSEILFEVKDDHVPKIKIEVVDLSHAQGQSKICTGYIVDNNVASAPSSFDGYLTNARIARSAAIFNIEPGISNRDFLRWRDDTSVSGAQSNVIADHNGYFFMTSKKSNSKLSFISAKHGDSPGTSYSGGSSIEETGQNYTNIDEGSFREIVYRLSSFAVAEPVRTLVTGNILDLSGEGIPKASVVAMRSEVYQCDRDGEYRFYHYSIRESGVGGNPSLDTFLIPVTSGNSCSPKYDENQIYDFRFEYGSWYPGGGTQPPNAVNNSVPLEIAVPNFTGDISSMIVINTFKRGFDGKFGIVYYDRGLRSGAVNFIDDLQLHIPFYTEKYDGQPQIKGVPYVDWEIKHRPPAWATHYQWVRTRNETVGSYFQWAAKDVRYTTADGTSASYNSGTRVRVSIDNFTKYKELNPTADLQIDLNGSLWRIRFIKDNGGRMFPEYVDMEILEYDSDNAEIVFEKDFSLPELYAGTTFEAYDSILDLENEIFYEFGECFEVGRDAGGNPYHKGLFQDQNAINPATVPATGRFRTGDAYYRLRSVPDVSANTPVYVDDDAVSDFYDSEVESIGRANGINHDIFQKWRPNQIRHGGKYIPDSNVNDISRFISSDFQPLPLGYGDINKLILASNVLLSIHEFRWVSNYIEEGILRKQNGTNEVIASTKVFDSFRAAKDITGTINPESVKEWRGKVYAADANKGLINKYDANGLTAVSDFKMVDFFADISKELLNDSERRKKQKILGFIDAKRDEYIITFKDVTIEGTSDQLGEVPRAVNFDVDRTLTIDGGTDNTLYSATSKEEVNNLIFDKRSTPDLKDISVDSKTDSKGVLNVKVIELDGSLKEVTKLHAGQGIESFNLEDNSFSVKNGSTDSPQVARVGGQDLELDGFTLAYSEKFNKWTTFYSFTPELYGGIDLEMLGFKNGKLWIHNDSEVRNNFYGEQYTSILETVFNSVPNRVKVFEAVAAESYHPWSVQKATTPNGMETYVVAGRFVRREDSYFAPMTRDINDPTRANEPDALINGRKLRDRTINVRFENDETEEVVLFTISMNGTISERHGR